MNTYAYKTETCRRCGATGYAESEFLNWWTGLCVKCHDTSKTKPSEHTEGGILDVSRL